MQTQLYHYHPNIYEELGAIMTKRATGHHEVHRAPFGLPQSPGLQAAHHEGGLVVGWNWGLLSGLVGCFEE